MSAFLRVLRFFHKRGIAIERALWCTLFFSGLSSVFLILQSYCIGQVIDSALSKPASGFIANAWEVLSGWLHCQKTTAAVGFYLAAVVGWAAADYAKNRMGMLRLDRLGQRLREDLFQSILQTSSSETNSSTIGDVMTAFGNDLDKIIYFICVLTQSIMALFLIAATAIFLLSVNRLLFCATLAIALVGWVAHTLTGKKIEQASSNTQKKLAALVQTMKGSLDNARALRLYGQETQEMFYLHSASAEHVRSLRAGDAVNSTGSLFQFAFQQGSILTTLCLGGYLAQHGLLTLGQLVAYFFQFQIFMNQFLSFGQNLWQSQDMGVSLERIQRYFQESEKESVRFQGKTPFQMGALRFSHVSVDKEGDGEKILQGIHILITPGQIVGVVGPVGAGKSTLLKLLPRLVDPAEGLITIGEVPLQEFSISALRSEIGYVGQTSCLFQGTVRENICFGVNPDQDKYLGEVLHAVNLEEEVTAWSQGLDTVIGEGGVSLSAGQCQRLALARAMMRNPAILILDDAFSHVDRITEQRIIQRLRKVCPRSTILFSSNNMAPLVFADLTVVLLKGKIAELGQHADLLRRKGFYTELFSQQTQEAEFFKKDIA